MSRRVLLLWVGLACSACLDDDLDPNAHFLRASLRAPEDDEPTSGSDADAGETSTRPGKTVQLGELKTFIAVDRDFADFLSWTSFDLGNGDHAIGQTGHKQVYINALPRSQDQEFRVGTIVVKVLELGDDPSTWQVHAMVKRGGGYNAQGAYGWEYFDFTLDRQGLPRQNWRGETAPAGESYQISVFTPNGVILQDAPDCNACHQSSHNDAVNAEALDLDRW